MSNEHLAADAVASRILDLANEFSPDFTPGKTFTTSSTLGADLGLDQLDALELVMAVEDEFDVDLDGAFGDEQAPASLLPLTVQALVYATTKALTEKQPSTLVPGSTVTIGEVEFEVSESPAAAQEAAYRAMVDRFLSWKLPQDFGPDAGIAFTPPPHLPDLYWPTGTNLFHAGQALEMFKHCLPAEVFVVDASEVAAAPAPLSAAPADIIRLTNGDDGVFAHVTAPNGKQYGINLECMACNAEDELDLAEKFFRAVVDRVKAGALPSPLEQATDGGPNPNYNPDAGAQMLDARVTPDMITAAIVSADYHVLPGTQITVCIITLRNGTKVLGYNYGTIDPAGQDWQLGRQAAYDMARERIWELEGYLLRERLATPTHLTLKHLSAEDEAALVESLRNFRPGPLVVAADPDHDRAIVALRRSVDAMRAFTEPEGNMPAETGEFDDLKAALAEAEGVLAHGGDFDSDVDKGAQHLSIVRAFLDKHHVSCPETIHQTDRVIENAYGLIEDLADVAGYYRDPDEDDAEVQP